jgi:Flp pilus assembly pilin Flp
MKFAREHRTPRVPDALLPAIMLLHVCRHRIQRVSETRADRDRGALSIELALLVIALVAVAVAIVIGINALVTRTVGKLDNT